MRTIAVFASGSGTNFEALAEACRVGLIDAKIGLVVCDKPSAMVCDRARRRGIEVFAFTPKAYPSKSAYEQQIIGQLDRAGVELVCLAGYMRIVSDTLLEAYSGRIVNIHPSLLPSFKGAHAISDALEYGVKVFGVTIHYVDHSLDGGKIIAQSAFEYDGCDIDELETKIHALEHRLYPATIARLINEM